ncbi:MAG: hypothetical protein KKD17_00385 [Nanoarchaeota archaeon]|nr:hypothetical protein [Nanoarchaeota archaeon]
MSYTTPEERSIIHELTGRKLVPRRGWFSKVYSLESLEESLGMKLVAGVAALAAAAGLSKAEPAYAQDTDSYDFPRVGEGASSPYYLPERIIVGGHHDDSQEEAADQIDLSPTRLIVEASANQESSDSRLELGIEGYEAAVRNWTMDGHSDGTTAFGMRTPMLFDFLQLRGYGFVNYGGDTSGGYNLSSFFTLPPVVLGAGVGHIIGSSADHIRPRVMVGGEFGPVRILADAFYDSGSEGLGEGFDARAVFSVVAKEFYFSAAKAEGLDFYSRFAVINPGGVGAVLLNVLDYDRAYSSNELILSFGSLVDREMLDALSLRESGADGSIDFAVDPTMDRLPFLGEYGKYNALLRYEHDADAHIVTGMFAYRPGESGTFLAVGAMHRYTPGDDLTSILLDVCAEFGGVLVMPSLRLDIQEPAFTGFIYVGNTFDI